MDGQRWVSGRPGFFLPVRVLSRLFRRLFLEKLVATHAAGRLQFFGNRGWAAARCGYRQPRTVLVYKSRIEAQAGRAIALGVGILATIGATAPFVGLFGTVWGIMDSFKLRFIGWFPFAETATDAAVSPLTTVAPIGKRKFRSVIASMR